MVVPVARVGRTHVRPKFVRCVGSPHTIDVNVDTHWGDRVRIDRPAAECYPALNPGFSFHAANRRTPLSDNV